MRLKVPMCYVGDIEILSGIVGTGRDRRESHGSSEVETGRMIIAGGSTAGPAFTRPQPRTPWQFSDRVTPGGFTEKPEPCAPS